ncbi:TIGR03826 family flagellar region protein [Marinisporobacter balticus]|uniref:Flagellar operon protein (TIGR03826 family) n=1 Tax=Marinisporobacter balticus TaxID=2018667 RepID=A0A4R2KRT1_9FIRM|nr:TIGR03826 family flagellar region protein [Marinisporobacter balticus]TCO76473.1 flagellar operon protein (TIGR03826 family) [Marinisporobacter balticus]
MAEIRNCKECGRLFQYNGFSKICTKCQRKREDDFKSVREYIYENKGATITEVSEETGVDEDKILQFLREGRLEITGENSALILECERCGKGIKTGRFCDACARELEKELKSGFTNTKEIKARKSEKMYTAERKKRS